MRSWTRGYKEEDEEGAEGPPRVFEVGNGYLYYLDEDGDLLPDKWEEWRASHLARDDPWFVDPHDRDTDDDGICDGVEIGVLDWDVNTEYLRPNDPDSDHDGAPDGYEIGITDPLWLFESDFVDWRVAPPLNHTNVNRTFIPRIDGQIAAEPRKTYQPR